MYLAWIEQVRKVREGIEELLVRMTIGHPVHRQ